MSRLLTAATLLLGGAVVAGCGTSASTPRVDPDVAGKPTWGGCQERSIGSIDYVVGARGPSTAKAALAPYRKDGDHVVRTAPAPHQRRQWLLVDEHNVIHTSLGLARTEHGWLVDTVERCAH